MQTQRKELNFEGQNIFVGIDVHLNSWNVTLLSEYMHLNTFNQPGKAESLFKHLNENYPGAAYFSVYEAGFCGFHIHYDLQKLGINNILVNPVDVPTTEKEKMTKTDKVDSNKLARSLRNKDLKGIYIPRRDTQEDRSLMRVRSSIVKDMTRLKQRIKSMLRFYGIEFPPEFQKSTTHGSNRFMLWLKEIKLQEASGTYALNALLRQAEQQRSTLLDVTRKVKELSQSVAYAEQMRLIKSLPGFGTITGMLFLSEIETIGRFSSADKLAGLIGVVPRCHNSGENQNTGEITPRGHEFLRKAIVESSWVAIRADPALTKAYSLYCQRMEPNKAIIRIARKLVNRLFFVLKHQQEYQTKKVQ